MSFPVRSGAALLLVFALVPACAGRRSSGGGGNGDDDDDDSTAGGDHALPDQGVPDGNLNDALGGIGGASSSGDQTGGEDPWDVVGDSGAGATLYVINAASSPIVSLYLTECGEDAWSEDLLLTPMPSPEYAKFYVEPGCYDVAAYPQADTWFWALADLDVSGLYSLFLVDPPSPGDDDDSTDPPSDGASLSVINDWENPIAVVISAAMEVEELTCENVSPGGRCEGEIPAGDHLGQAFDNFGCYWTLDPFSCQSGQDLEIRIGPESAICF